MSNTSNKREKGLTFCILGASFETRNMGVNALAASTVASIMHSFPDARVFILDYAKTPVTRTVRHQGGSVDVPLVNVRFSWRLHLPNNIARLLMVAFVLRVLPFSGLRKSWLARNPYLAAIDSADVVGSLAGGDSFSDIYGLRRLFYVCLPQLLVLMMGKPLTLLPQTLGPFKGFIAKRLCGYIMRSASRVYARDRQSLAEVHSMMKGHEENLALSYDMAFLMQPFEPADGKPAWLANRKSDRPLVGLNISGLLFHGGYSQNNMFGLRANYQEMVREIIRMFIEDNGADVVLVPHVYGTGKDVDTDTETCRVLCAELQPRYGSALNCITREYDQHEIKYLIGCCDFFLGSRMHACIAALSQGVPALGLAYSKKFAGVLGTIGVEDLVIDLRNQDLSEIRASIGNAYASRGDVRARLLAKMPEVKTTVAGVFDRITRDNLPRGRDAACLENLLACSESKQDSR